MKGELKSLIINNEELLEENFQSNVKGQTLVYYSSPLDIVIVDSPALTYDIITTGLRYVMSFDTNLIIVKQVLKAQN